MSIAIGKWLSVLFIVLFAINLLAIGFNLQKIVQAFLVAIILPLAFSLFIAVFAYLMGIIFPVSVSPEFIKATNYFGLKKSLKWESIKNLTLQSVSGFPYLVLEGDSNSTLWISLLLKDEEIFKELVLKYSSKKNPTFKLLFFEFFYDE